MSTATSSPSDGPKTFISYSWSSPDHEAWVIDLAKQLVEAGVDVILDKWDLREGADKYAFMEKMVTDPSVRKVVVICDRSYAEKADGREGGVGTETQIISQEIYGQIDPADRQQKFVGVITQKDETGRPYVPTFLKSRIYIDMAQSEDRTTGFEQLLRWIYDRPLYIRPEKGKPPAFLFEGTSISMGTTVRFQRAVDSLKQGKVGALGALTEYFNTFANNLERLRLQSEESNEFDDKVVESIEAFLPYRNEVLEVLLAVANFHADLNAYLAIHRFFEKLLPLGYWPRGATAWTDWTADNLRFAIHELFLYTVAILLKHDRFEGVIQLTQEDYFFPTGSPEVESGMVPFTFFRHYLKTLAHRNSRLDLRRLSVTADLLEKRAKLTEVCFDDIMQADFFLFLYSDLNAVTDKFSRDRWWPETLLYADRHRGPFEVFARGQSSRYFNNLKGALRIDSKAHLEKLLGKYKSQELKIPRWEFESFNPQRLMNYEQLATKP